MKTSDDPARSGPGDPAGGGPGDRGRRPGALPAARAGRRRDRRSLRVRASLSIFCLLLAGASQAEPFRQYGTHVHGLGLLDLALEGDQLLASLRSPGADIVGFEFRPRVEAQALAIETAVAALRDAERILGLPADAGCGLDDVEVRSAMLSENHDGAPDGVQSANAGRQGVGERSRKAHAEFAITYRLTCARPEEIDHLTLGYFRAFDRAREVRVQAIGPWGQTLGTVTRDRPRLDF